MFFQKPSIYYIYSIKTRLSEHILALVNWTCCAPNAGNIVLIKPGRLWTILVCLNPPQLATVLALIAAVMCLNSFVQQLLSVEAALTHSPRFFFMISPTFFLSLPAPNKDNNQHWNPLTCHLGGCVGQPPIQILFSFPQEVQKRERCGRISCERPFLYVSHTIVRLSVEGRPSGRGGWQGKSLCTCSPTQRHRVTTGSDTRINLYRRLCLIT